MELEDETHAMAATSSNDGSDLDSQVVSSGKDRARFNMLAVCLVSAAASWFLLQALAGVLRPLLLAVLVSYLLLPLHRYLRQWLPSVASVAVLAVAAVGILCLLAVILHRNAVELNEELPHLVERGQAIGRRAQQFWIQRIPSWMAIDTGAVAAKTNWEEPLSGTVHALTTSAAAAFTGALVVGLYLLFMLLDAGQFSDRLRRAFPGARGEQILAVIARINTAATGYLWVKVQASLLLAALVTPVLWIFGVKFALLWGLLTFVANFIPYVGSLVACSLPILFAVLQFDLGWRAGVVALLLVASHVLVGYVIEPAMTGRAVGLNPLVVLIALAFWGECWGLIGVVLAVPLTVVLKIVMENLAFTRPFARLLAEE
jgi:AI-2 transport protein TqsA